MNYLIKALQVAEHFNLKKFKSAYPDAALISTASELFYFLGEGQYFYLTNYGVAVFANCSPEKMLDYLERVKVYADGWLVSSYQETFSIAEVVNIDNIEVKSDELLLPSLLVTDSIIRLTMLQVAHSVALDYYEVITESVLNESYKYTRQLEVKGKVKISKRNLMRFIGKTLNVKNSIVDNLYILDDHGSVWDNPQLDEINKGLKEVFDLQLRFKDIDYKLRIVEDNLKLFTDLLQHRESSRLEWIIIILILIEIVNMFWREIL